MNTPVGPRSAGFSLRGTSVPLPKRPAEALRRLKPNGDTRSGQYLVVPVENVILAWALLEKK